MSAPRAFRSARAAALLAAAAAAAALRPPALAAQGAVPGAPAAGAAEAPADAPAEVRVLGPRGAAVAGAQVSLTPVRATPGVVFARGGTTGDDGRIRLAGLPAGRATLAVRRLGFRPVSMEVTLPAAAPVEVTLEVVPQQLAEVVVRGTRRGPYTGRLGDFRRRRDMGFGRFFTAEEIDERRPMYTSDLLRMVPGVNVVGRGGGVGNSIRIRNSPCPPLVWLDGSPAGAGYLDVDAFPPNSLAGIEVYSGVATVPVELRGARGEGACGVIALWSRVPEPGSRRPKNPVTAEQLARLVEQATVFTADQVQQPAQLDTAEMLDLRYPDGMRRAKTAGEAVVEFVVDTAGRVEWETVGVVAATHPEFAEAARMAARTARFLPAQRAGRVVRQLVQLPLRWDPAR